MSASGIVDAIIAAAQTAVPGVTAERGLRQLHEVAEGEFPHLFVYAVTRPLREVLEWGQRREELEVSLRWATDSPQAEALTEWEAVIAGLEADPTLGGLADTLSVDADQLLEHPDAGDRRATDALVRVERTQHVGNKPLSPAPAPVTLRDQLLAALDAALLAQTTVSEVTPDPLARLRSIDPGATVAGRLALISGYVPTSNQAYRQMAVVLSLAHRVASLGDPEEERDYLNGPLLDDLEVIAKPRFWWDLDVPLASGGRGVLSLTQAPSVETTVRVGHVLETGVSCQFTLAEEP